MNDFPTNVKEKLNSIISDMADHHWLFSNNPLSASAAARFHFPLSSICSRNSLLPFQGLPTSSKITASLHVMVVMLFTLPIRKLLWTIINLALLTTKGITTCI